MFRQFVHFWQFVGAVVRQVIGLIGLVLTLWPVVAPHLPRLISDAVARLLTPNNYSLIGISLLFWAAFRAWDEQRELADKASPESLRVEIASLKVDVESQRRRILNAKQRNELETAIRETLRDEEYLGFSLLYNWMDGEAEQYARQFAAVFVPLSVSGPAQSTQEVPADLEGLIIGVKDENAIPRNAHRLAEVLRKANIVHRFGAVPGWRNSHVKPDHVELIVGRRSEHA